MSTIVSTKMDITKLTTLTANSFDDGFIATSSIIEVYFIAIIKDFSIEKEIIMPNFT